ncbi:serine/threonine-protein phosphatase 4 regulatory subunit 2-like [Stegodyphus dumicola]|uniref:serine/threonine-protein phosphatase 4 regulatory subunit 2-like n=1 Tax=Stegodyphus dumicola TaxID=202533 RepID=UPI0015A7B26D|nr:serine/threonine-protein phosphatase 4 regulatory subunit 2-like [Stegodyphus dumicola]
MELNAESILDALNDFERKPVEIPPILEEYLQRIAQNGEIIFPWCKLKPLLKRKLELVLDEFYETCPAEVSLPVPNFETFNFDNLKKSILQAVDSFTSAPFTIQRLCELVTNPKKHYNRTDKYMRGIEKNVLVVSTIEPRVGVQGDGNNANLNPVVNGMISDSPRDDNDCFNGHENSDNVSSSNINTPPCHVLLENFANVFPSAACIPSASNICINREIDNNFMANSECVETQEVEFENSMQAEQAGKENIEAKEEAMEASSEEMQTTSAINEEVTSGVVVSSENSNIENEFPPAEDKQPNNDVQSEESSSSISTDDKNEKEKNAGSSGSCTANSDKEANMSSQCQQDDTVSQSDDSSHDVTKISQSDEVNSNTSQGADNEVDSEVSQNISTSESSENSMELESSSSNEQAI